MLIRDEILGFAAKTITVMPYAAAENTRGCRIPASFSEKPVISGKGPFHQPPGFGDSRCVKAMFALIPSCPNSRADSRALPSGQCQERAHGARRLNFMEPGTRSVLGPLGSFEPAAPG